MQVPDSRRVYYNIQMKKKLPFFFTLRDIILLFTFRKKQDSKVSNGKQDGENDLRELLLWMELSF